MKDKCIICKKETLFDTTDHIDSRYGYIEGAGQLCVDCYENNSSKQSNEVCIPVNTVLDYPNDQELGSLIRKRTFKQFFGV